MSLLYLEGNVLFNNAYTFYLWLYGIGDMIKDHSDSEREHPLQPLHGIFFFCSSSKASFIYTITDVHKYSFWSGHKLSQSFEYIISEKTLLLVNNQQMYVLYVYIIIRENNSSDN